MTAALERLQALMTPVPAPKVAGQWFNIRYSPNPASGELFNVGVAYLDSTRQRIHARLIENLEAFRAIFGEAFEDEVRFALEVARSALGKTMLESPVRNIAFGEPRYAAGESAQEIVDWLFSTTVSFAEAKQVNATKREPGQNNTTVRKAVFDSIRLKAGLNADRIIAQDPVYWVDKGDRKIPLEIPLRSDRLLGSVVSANYRSKQPLENNLLRSSLDLETAARIFKQDRLGFFVMRAAEEVVSGPIDPSLDEVLDTTCWKLHKHGIHVGVEESPDLLAEDILSWSGL